MEQIATPGVTLQSDGGDKQRRHGIVCAPVGFPRRCLVGVHEVLALVAEQSDGCLRVGVRDPHGRTQLDHGRASSFAGRKLLAANAGGDASGCEHATDDVSLGQGLRGLHLTHAYPWFVNERDGLSA